MKHLNLSFRNFQPLLCAKVMLVTGNKMLSVFTPKKLKV